MSVALLIITDGRDEYLDRTVASAAEHLVGRVDERWMFDDTGDETYRAKLAARHPTFTHIHGGRRQGFGGAIRSAWMQLTARSKAQHVFHLEADFTFNRGVDLPAMVDVLDDNPHLVQLALRRQPWNGEEHAAGGIVEQHPEAYHDRTDQAGRQWLQHRLFFTTNPCLYRATLCSYGWPSGPQSEGHFGQTLLRSGSPEVSASLVHFGFWGGRDSGPAVEHIGHTRAGTGY